MKLQALEAKDMKARRLQGHYVKPYCRMLAKESLKKEIHQWEKTKETVVSAFTEAGHHHHQQQQRHAQEDEGIDEDGESSWAGERDTLMPAGLESAVPLPLSRSRPSSHSGISTSVAHPGLDPEADANHSSNTVVWFPRGPEDDTEMDPGQRLLQDEAREADLAGLT